ncbi:site-2 protease family protein [Thermospira aquatica]|uniref:Site-2 protease family protein n=1 Tax=Thermospira aquatica TaxID=2828656 RepID=A0AAX3BEQ8_9SPIR|nr:site-2 protease family protein [Thermospira aquatica]URA10829.1 site-2 protease family protein [Thermospira aquatica]
MKDFSFFSVINMVIFWVGVMYSIILHEIGHGLVARWWGDDTAYKNGRLSLSPFHHIDPVGTVLVPVFMYLTTGSIFSMLNLFLAFFNLLPLPPLDGFRLVMAFLPEAWQEKIEPYLFPLGILLILIFINSPLFSFLVNTVLGGVFQLLGHLYGIL